MTDRDLEKREAIGDKGAKLRDSEGPSAAVYAGLGFQLLVSILIFLYLGQWLDHRFGTKGILTVIAVLVGAGGAIYSVYRRLVAEQARSEESRK